MKQPVKTRRDIEAGSNHFLRRVCPQIGVPLGEIDYLRGHKDDFFGDFLRDEYDTEITGAGSIVATLVNGAHGGWVNLHAGAGAGRRSILWLGDQVRGYATLGADEGWTQIIRMKCSAVTDATLIFGVFDQDGLAQDLIVVGYLTPNSATNWVIVTRTGGGAVNVEDSGVAADTDWHWHALNVFPITGGRQVDYFLDGARIATTITDVPAQIITPLIRAQAGVAATRELDVDFWAVIPRNL